jgi:hypothetical protein
VVVHQVVVEQDMIELLLEVVQEGIELQDMDQVPYKVINNLYLMEIIQ